MQTFQKTERLRSKKVIEHLFVRGQTIKNYPLKLIWLDTNIQGPYPVNVLITVSKKGIKRAVDRNKLKRRMREAYRKNKFLIYDYLKQENRTCAIGLIYNGKEISSYEEIERKIINSLERFILGYEKIIR